MSFQYDILECPDFTPQLFSLDSHEQELISVAIKDRLSLNPTSRKNPVRSKLLSGNLECLRRIHANDDLLILYSVCQECRENDDCQQKLGCYECYKIDRNTVILIACGHWREIYEHILSSRYYYWVRNVKATYES